MRRRRYRPPHGAFFWRVYLHGVLLLVLVVAAVAAAAWASSPAGPWTRPERVAEYAAERVAELSDRPGRLRDELRRVREVFGVEATVYAPDATAVIASNVEPPLAPALPAGAAPGRRPIHIGGHHLRLAVPLPGGGHAVFTPAPHGDPRRAVLFFAAVLAALALGSIPLARSIAAPIESLTRAARALGGGDLTARARVRAHGEVGELGHAFDEMAERLERLVRGEQELLANVSHEIRTPLARIRVALELAAEGDLERARRFLAEIGADLDELDRLVGDVLAAARLDAAAAGAVALRRAPVETAALLAEATGWFHATWPGRELAVDAAPELPGLDGDAALLRRLLVNLLDNAAKYSEAPAPVVLAARAEPGGLVLEVRDRGIGVDPADLPRLFTPFFRTDRSRARGTGGVGLGLALARRIAEAHGGAIAVEPAPGGGTIFRVTLPRAAAPANAG